MCILEYSIKVETQKSVFLDFRKTTYRMFYLFTIFSKSNQFPPCLSSGKSDSVLAMADATLDHLDHDALFLCHLEPSIFADRLSPYHSSPPTTSFVNLNHTTPTPRFGNIRRSSSTGSQDLLRLQTNNHQTHAPTARISRLSAFLQEMENDDGQEALLNNQVNEQRTLNGRLLASVTNADRLSTNRLSSKGQAHRAGMVKGRYDSDDDNSSTAITPSRHEPTGSEVAAFILIVHETYHPVDS